MPDKPKSEIPDLVLEPPAPKTASNQGTPSVAPRGHAALGESWGASDAFGASDDFSLASLSEDPLAASHDSNDSFDLLSNDASGLDLGLDLERAYAPEPAASAHPASVPHSSARTRSSRPAPRIWPTGRTAVPEELTIDPLEVAVTAHFEAAPNFFLQTPVYALQVFLRKRSLRADEQAARERLLKAEDARDDLSVALAETARPALEENDRFRVVLMELRECESLASQRSEALGRVNADAASVQNELDARLATISAEQALAEQAVQNAQLTFDKTLEAVKRVDVQIKRIEIERRSVLDVARQRLGPSGGAMPPDLAAKVAELEARKAALDPELATLRGDSATAKLVVDEAEGKLRALTRETRSIENAKHQQLKSQQNELTLRNQGVGEAELRRRSALIGVGQRVLEMRGEVPVDGGTLDALTAADQLVSRELVATEKLRRALDSYDHETEKKGRLIGGAILALLFVVLLLALK